MFNPYDKSCSATLNGKLVTPAEFSRVELERARVSLALLKKRLGTQGLKDLLSEHGSSAHEQLKNWVAKSGGRWTSAKAEIQVSRGKAKQFLDWFRQLGETGDEASLIAAHPEHFVVAPLDDGRLEVIETTGHWGKPHLFYMQLGLDRTIAPHLSDIDTNFPHDMVGMGQCYDGTPMMIAAHQFRDCGDGFECRLAIYFPAGANVDMVAGHRWHLALEFTNWINAYLEASGLGQIDGENTKYCKPSIDDKIISEDEFVREELRRARSALGLIKSLLGVQGLRTLLAQDSEVMHPVVREAFHSSNGQWELSSADISVDDGSAEGFLDWFSNRVSSNDQMSLLAAHPEHFLVSPTADGSMEVIETTGQWLSPHRFFMRLIDNPQDSPHADDLSPEFPFAMAGLGQMEDNTPVARVLHQFRNRGTGFEAKLRAYFPAASNPALISGHCWHLVLEFTNWISLYLAEKRAQ